MANFHEQLRQELIEAQKERGALVRQKLTFVITALGIGAVSTDAFPARNLLFLAPLISFVFDLYIAGVDYQVKRAGAFLGAPDAGTSEVERLWEGFVAENRDPFSRTANPLLSVLVLLASAVGLWASYGVSPFYLGWLLLNILLTAGVWYFSYKFNRTALESPVILPRHHGRNG